MLEITGLNAFYGDFQALFDIDISLGAGETLALIGANGAGKTSLLQAVCGLNHATGGIVLNGASLTGLAPQLRAAAGVGLSPEGRRMFASLSVRENLEIGANTGRKGPWSLARVTSLFPILGEFADRPSRLLSGGQQQMVAIGRALMSNPALLLLDEVSLGLAPVVADEVMGALSSIRGESEMMTILVEQDVARAIKASNRFACLLEGRNVLNGTSKGADLDAISRAYFGEDTA
ncbi:ABC transporter ATP-binding protein [Neptunicoccus cionae]|uniref:ABC transporter ATP-binding protein n=1 Tax=Neptunicoccus cionae TaxID=2035344 RepID=UPI001C60A45F|nr:ABC transporter ATP-binding protein [Amylibacter cionae]